MILKWHTLEMVSDCLYLKKKKKIYSNICLHWYKIKKMYLLSCAVCVVTFFFFALGINNCN